MATIAIPLDLPLLQPPAHQTTDPESAIAGALERDDPSAIEALWREYGRTVFAYLVRTLRDRGEAEDVHQQVFAEAWQRRRQYDSRRGSLLTWLMTIARSRAIDNLRRRRPEPTDPTMIESGPGDQHDPEDEMLERWRVVHLLRRIPRGEAEMLRLRFYEGLSQREIATASRCPSGPSR